jgi:hypothetical protein
MPVDPLTESNVSSGLPAIIEYVREVFKKFRHIPETRPTAIWWCRFLYGFKHHPPAARSVGLWLTWSHALHADSRQNRRPEIKGDFYIYTCSVCVGKYEETPLLAAETLLGLCNVIDYVIDKRSSEQPQKNDMSCDFGMTNS